MNSLSSKRWNFRLATLLILTLSSISEADPPGGLKKNEALLAADPAEPNPGEPFSLGLEVEYGDTSLRPQLQVSISLDPQLAANFQGVQIADPLEDLSASATLNGQTLSVQIADDGSPSLPKYPMKRPILVLNFSGIAAGTYSFGPTAASATDLGGSPIKLKFQFMPATFEVSPPRILTTSLPPARTTRTYAADFRASHLEAPVTWSLSSGSLPQGLQLGPAAVVAGVVASGQTGVYQFVVRATGADSSFVETQLSLNVTNEAPRLEDAVFVDQDSSQTVSPGDTITLRFDEDVQAGPQAASSLSPTRSGDAFGQATVTQGQHPNFLVLTLGPGASLTKLGTKSGAQVSPLAGGIIDSEGQPVVASATKILENFPAPGLQNWVVGVAISPITLTSEPFSNPKYKVEGLPEGVTYSNGVISGAPAIAGRAAFSVAGGDIVGEAIFGWQVSAALCDNVSETAAPPEFTVEGRKAGCHAAGDDDIQESSHHTGAAHHPGGHRGLR